MLSTMARNDLGRTIIDELRLCYVAEPTLLAGLSETNFGERINYDDFALYRVGSRNFQCAFDVVYGTDKVATLRFWHHVEQEMSSYVFYRIENRVLYDDEVLRKTLILPDILGMEFQHITSMDLARDFKFNAVQRIRKLAKDESIKVIVNGKAISKDKDVPEGMFVFPLNFKKLNSPTIVIKQSKAVRDKTKGLHYVAITRVRRLKPLHIKTISKISMVIPSRSIGLKFIKITMKLKIFARIML